MADKYYYALHVVDHCNLNCLHCSHFAPYRKKKFYDAEDYFLSLDKLTSLNLIKSLGLTGGETFLHPNLLDFCKKIRDRYKNIKITLLTNGFWLKSEESILSKLDIFSNIDLLQVTMYPAIIDKIGDKEYKRLRGILKKHVCVSQLFSGVVEEFFEIKFSSNANYNNKCPYIDCCQILPNGKLMRCPIGYSILSGYENFPHSEMFFDLNTDDDVLSWRKKFPFDSCRNCLCYHNKTKWSQMDRSKSML